jgi:hypothetical protein
MKKRKPRTDSEKTKLRRLKQQVELRKKLLDGVPHTQIRKELRVTKKVFDSLLRRVFRSFEDDESEDATDALRITRSRLLQVCNKAMKVFEESVGEHVETTTQIKTEKCPKCHGNLVNRQGEDCEYCECKGEIQITNVTKKRKKSAGDVNALKEFRLCAETIAKLEGFLGVQRVEVQGQLQHNHRHLAISDDNQFKNISDDHLIKSIALLEDVGQGEKSSDDIIDVEVVDSEEGDISG